MQTSDAQKMFDHSMSGAPQPDGFGTKLPAGFTTAFLVEQLAPGQDARSVVLSGAKPWPLRPNSYVAMICLADSPERAASALKYPPASCDSLGDDDTGPRRVWFGVFETNGSGAPRLVARTEAPVATPTDWRDTNIDRPHKLDASDAGSEQEAMCRPAGPPSISLHTSSARANTRSACAQDGARVTPGAVRISKRCICS
jgi:hypothetical protein